MVDGKRGVKRGTIHTFIVDYDVTSDDQRICLVLVLPLKGEEARRPREISSQRSTESDTQLTGSRCPTLGPLDLGRTFGSARPRSAYASNDQPNGRLIARR